jgi:hypothetical protein
VLCVSTTLRARCVAASSTKVATLSCSGSGGLANEGVLLSGDANFKSMSMFGFFGSPGHAFEDKRCPDVVRAVASGSLSHPAGLTYADIGIY